MLGYNNSEDKGNWNEEQQVSTSVELPFAAQPESVYMGSSASEKGIVSNQNTSMKGNILLVFCSLSSTYSCFSCLQLCMFAMTQEVGVIKDSFQP